MPTAAPVVDLERAKALAAQPFDPDGTGYDYATALAAGLGPDETGHWPSRDPRTGQILKGRKHETFSLTEQGERDSGYRISRGDGGRYFSQPAAQLDPDLQRLKERLTFAPEPPPPPEEEAPTQEREFKPEELDYDLQALYYSRQQGFTSPPDLLRVPTRPFSGRALEVLEQRAEDRLEQRLVAGGLSPYAVRQLRRLDSYEELHRQAVQEELAPNFRNYMEDFVTSLKAGHLQVDADHAWFSASIGTGSVQEAQLKDKRLEEFLNENPLLEWGTVGKWGMGAAAMAAPMAESMLEGGLGALAGSVVPGVGTAGGFTAGTAQFWFRQGAGDQYRKSIQEGMNPTAATAFAWGTGAVYAGLEMMQIGKFLKPLRRGAVTKAVFEKTLDRWTKSKLARDLATGVANYAEQNLQEVLQQLAQDLGENLARAWDNEVGGKDFAYITGEELAANAVETFKQSFGPLLIFAGLPTVGQMALKAREYAQEMEPPPPPGAPPVQPPKPGTPARPVGPIPAPDLPKANVTRKFGGPAYAAWLGARGEKASKDNFRRWADEFAAEVLGSDAGQTDDSAVLTDLFVKAAGTEALAVVDANELASWATNAVNLTRNLRTDAAKKLPQLFDLWRVYTGILAESPSQNKGRHSRPFADLHGPATLSDRLSELMAAQEAKDETAFNGIYQGILDDMARNLMELGFAPGQKQAEFSGASNRAASLLKTLGYELQMPEKGERVKNPRDLAPGEVPRVRLRPGETADSRWSLLVGEVHTPAVVTKDGRIVAPATVSIGKEFFPSYRATDAGRVDPAGYWTAEQMRGADYKGESLLPPPTAIKPAAPFPWANNPAPPVNVAQTGLANILAPGALTAAGLAAAKGSANFGIKVRALDKAQLKVLEKVIQGLYDLGMPIQNVITQMKAICTFTPPPTGFNANLLGFFQRDTMVIGVRDERLNQAETSPAILNELVHTFAHELGHLIDATWTHEGTPGNHWDLTNKSAPRDKSKLATTSPLVQEIIDVFLKDQNNHGTLGATYNYPFNYPSYYGVYKMPSELFAQTVANYYTNPAEVQRQMPQVFAYMEANYGRFNRQGQVPIAALGFDFSVRGGFRAPHSAARGGSTIDAARDGGKGDRTGRRGAQVREAGGRLGARSERGERGAGVLAEAKRPPDPASQLPAKAPRGPRLAHLADKLLDRFFAWRDTELARTKVLKARFQETIKKVAGEKTYGRTSQKYGRAILLYIDLKGRTQEELDKYIDKLSAEQIRLVMEAQNLPPELRTVGDEIIAHNRRQGQLATRQGVLKGWHEDYIMRLWALDKNRPELVKGFKTWTPRSMSRSLSSVLEGWSLGYELRVNDVTEAFAVAREEVYRTVANKALVDTLLRLGVLSRRPLDGYKVVTPKRNIRGLPARFYAPKEQNIAGRLQAIMGSAFTDEVGWARALTKAVLFLKHTVLFYSFFHHLAFMRSYMLGAPTGVANLNPVRAHKDGLKAIMEFGPDVQLLVGPGGLTLGETADWREARLFRDEQGKLNQWLEKHKVTAAIRDKMKALQDWHAAALFNHFGNGLKMQAALLELAHLRKLHARELETGKVTDAQLAKRIGDAVNDDFGGLHLERMGRNPNTQALFRMVALAPDWTESNVRSLVKAFQLGKDAEVYRMMWGRVLLRVAVMTMAFNFLLAGMDPDEFWRRYEKAWGEGRLRWLDVDVSPIQEAISGPSPRAKYFSLGGHFFDFIRWGAQPFRTVKAKGSVLTKIAIDALTGSDWAGRPFTTASELWDEKKFTKWRVGGGRTVGWPTVPSWIGYETQSLFPVPVQSLAAWIEGQADGFTAALRGAGVHVSESVPKQFRK